MTSRRAKFRVLLFLFGLALVALLYLRFFPALGTQRSLQAIRLAGLPASANDLDVWYAQVPVEQNLALAVLSASKELVEPSGHNEVNSSKWGPLTAPNPLSPEFREAMARHVEKNKLTLAKLRGIEDLSASRYPLDLTQGINTLLPHLARVKGLVQLLRSDAWNNSRLGNRKAAVEDVIVGLAVARSLRAEPILISQFIRDGCVAISLQTLERVVSEQPLDNQELLRLANELSEAEEDTRNAIFRALVGERAIGMGAFSMSFKDMGNLGNGSSSGSDSFLHSVAFDAYCLVGLRERDLGVYLETMNDFINAASNSFPEALRLSLSAEDKMQRQLSHGLGKMAILSRMLLPSLAQALDKEAALAAQLRCARAALAVERFRLANSGSLPANLEDLVPLYLPALPSNPCTGEPLQYDRASTNGFRIMCPASAARNSDGAKPKDTVFGVYR